VTEKNPPLVVDVYQRARGRADRRYVDPRTAGITVLHAGDTNPTVWISIVMGSMVLWTLPVNFAY